jgi:hypothetical protein
MLLIFVAAQAHFSALAQICPPPPPPPPGGQHPALLASYAKRPPWKVAGVDYAVGVPSMTVLTDWKLLSGPGITMNTTAIPPYVRVDDTSNVVISGVDFSLHGGAIVLFINSPNPTVTNSNFGGVNLTKMSNAAIWSDPNSPNLTASYNTMDGAGPGTGAGFISSAGSGTTTLTYNWFKNFPNHILEMLASAPFAIVYKYNLIEQGGMQVGAHPNLLQEGTNSDSASIDVEYNTSYQTHQVAGGEQFQFASYGTGLIKNVTLAYNVLIAAGSGIAVSYTIHGGGAQNAGVAHDNYIDRTATYGWLYPGSVTGWKFSNNYNMTTGAPL